MEKHTSSRRRFIALGFGVAILSGLMLWLGKSGKWGARQARLLRIKKSSVPPSGALVFDESRVAITRDGGQVTAYDLRCPHLGCTVQVGSRDWVCPCHGSRFDRSGRVLRGPADRDLRQLRLEEQGEELSIRL